MKSITTFLLPDEADSDEEQAPLKTPNKRICSDYEKQRLDILALQTQVLTKQLEAYEEQKQAYAAMKQYYAEKISKPAPK